MNSFLRIVKAMHPPAWVVPNGGLARAEASRQVGAMLALATVTYADFLPALQQDFELSTSAGQATLALVAAREHEPAGAAAGRAPFSLTFQGEPALRLPQGIYRLENATLGAMEIFLVQLAAGPEASTFEAVFT